MAQASQYMRIPAGRNSQNLSENMSNMPSMPTSVTGGARPNKWERQNG